MNYSRMETIQGWKFWNSPRRTECWKDTNQHQMKGRRSADFAAAFVSRLPQSGASFVPRGGRGSVRGPGEHGGVWMHTGRRGAGVCAARIWGLDACGVLGGWGCVGAKGRGRQGHRGHRGQGAQEPGTQATPTSQPESSPGMCRGAQARCTKKPRQP